MKSSIISTLATQTVVRFDNDLYFCKLANLERDCTFREKVPLIIS